MGRNGLVEMHGGMVCFVLFGQSSKVWRGGFVKTDEVRGRDRTIVVLLKAVEMTSKKRKIE